MKLVRGLVVGASGVLLMLAACSSDDTTPPGGTLDLDGGGLNLDGATALDSGPTGLGDAGPDATTSTGACATLACPFACVDGACTGVCGPGATQCAEKSMAGVVGGTDQTIHKVCIGGDACSLPHPAALVVRTCNAVGQWEETSNCGSQCEPNPVQVVVGCGYCSLGGGSPVAMCLGNVQDSCNCPAH